MLFQLLPALLLLRLVLCLFLPHHPLVQGALGAEPLHQAV